MPFGLCNAPATFQRAMDVILSRYKWQNCLIYLDDIVIFSSSLDEHLKDVENILSTLRNAGLSLKLNKCEFFTRSVNYLGHVVRPGKLEVASKTCKSVQEFLEPTTQTELRSFLGLCNVYRRFVKNFARISSPLNDLLTKGRPKELEPFTEAEYSAYKELKEKLVSPPVLKLFQPDLPVILETDACNRQVGCILLQKHEDGIHPVGYWSRTLNSAEKNYSATERECLALVWACQILRPYLEGISFIARTDHEVLKWLVSLTDTSGRLARWRLRLSEFTFTVEYKRGKENVAADALSRLPTTGLSNVDVEEDIPVYPIECSMAKREDNYPCDDDIVDDDELDDLQMLGGVVRDIADDAMLVRSHRLQPNGRETFAFATEPVHQTAPLSAISAEDFVLEQARDAYCTSIRDDLDQTTEGSPFFLDDRGILCRHLPKDLNVQIVVPVALRQKILRISHYTKVAGHPGGTRMYHTLRQHYYWPSLPIDVYNVVRNCTQCAKERVKLRKKKSFLKLFPASRPLQYVAIDILGPLQRTKRKNTHVLVITDRFSKMTLAIPLARTDALSVAKAFIERWVFQYGPPEYLLSDRGTQFVSSFMQSCCKILGIRQVFTSAYHPQTNGQAERFNRTLLAGIRALCGEHSREWDSMVGSIAYGYNTTVNRTIGMSPFELVLTTPPPHMALKAMETVDTSDVDQGSPKATRRRFTRRLKAVMATATERLHIAQARYKRYFDRTVRPQRMDLRPDSLVYLRREAPRTQDKEEASGFKEHKLRPIAIGPYRVVKQLKDDHTVVIVKDDGTEDVVPLERVVPAPLPSMSEDLLRQQSAPEDPGDTIDGQGIPDPDSDRTLRSANRTLEDELPALQLPKAQENKKSRRKRRRARPAYARSEAELEDPTDTYEFENIVGYQPSKNLYKVKWSNDGGVTWEPSANVPRSAACKYHALRKISLPGENVNFLDDDR